MKQAPCATVCTAKGVRVRRPAPRNEKPFSPPAGYRSSPFGDPGLICLLFLFLLWSFSCGGPAPSSTSLPSTEPEPALETPIEKEAISNLDMDAGQKVSVYYRHPLIEGIIPRPKKIFATANPAGLVKQVIDHLTIPPEDGFGTPLWPPNTYIREVYPLEDGTLVIDFDAGFVESLAVSITEEELLVYSLVNSILESFPDYKTVMILVGGSVRETFLGHIDIEHPLQTRYNMYTLIPEPRLSEQILVEELDEDPKEEDPEPLH